MSYYNQRLYEENVKKQMTNSKIEIELLDKFIDFVSGDTTQQPISISNDNAPKTEVKQKEEQTLIKDAVKPIKDAVKPIKDVVKPIENFKFIKRLKIIKIYLNTNLII